eukprot:jgi/Bigna1/87244/estExt_fgenesh1_pg.C_180068
MSICKISPLFRCDPLLWGLLPRSQNKGLRSRTRCLTVSKLRHVLLQLPPEFRCVSLPRGGSLAAQIANSKRMMDPLSRNKKPSFHLPKFLKHSTERNNPSTFRHRCRSKVLSAAAILGLAIVVMSIALRWESVKPMLHRGVVTRKFVDGEERLMYNGVEFRPVERNMKKTPTPTSAPTPKPAGDPNAVAEAEFEIDPEHLEEFLKELESKLSTVEKDQTAAAAAGESAAAAAAAAGESAVSSSAAPLQSYLRKERDTYKPAADVTAARASKKALFSAGDRVKAYWMGFPRKKYPGVIKKSNKDGTYHINFDDGDVDKRCPAEHIFLKKHQHHQEKERALFPGRSSAQSPPPFPKKEPKQTTPPPSLDEMIASALGGDKSKISGKKFTKFLAENPQLLSKPQQKQQLKPRSSSSSSSSSSSHLGGDKEDAVASWLSSMIQRAAAEHKRRKNVNALRSTKGRREEEEDDEEDFLDNEDTDKEEDDDDDEERGQRNGDGAKDAMDQDYDENEDEDESQDGSEEDDEDEDEQGADDDDDDEISGDDDEEGDYEDSDDEDYTGDDETGDEEEEEEEEDEQRSKGHRRSSSSSFPPSKGQKPMMTMPNLATKETRRHVTMTVSKVPSDVKNAAVYQHKNNLVIQGTGSSGQHVYSMTIPIQRKEVDDVASAYYDRDNHEIVIRLSKVHEPLTWQFGITYFVILLIDDYNKRQKSKENDGLHPPFTTTLS